MVLCYLLSAGCDAVLRMVKGGYLCSYNHILLTQLGLNEGFRNWVSKVLGCPFFRGRAQYTIINMYLLIEIWHNICKQYYGNYNEVIKISYTLAIDILRNSIQFFRVTCGVIFEGLGAHMKPGKPVG